MKWQPIETAPKDGTWITLWREPAKEGDHWTRDPMVIGRWHDDDQEWAWPDGPFDPFTPHGIERANEMLERGDAWGDDAFSHWMPLPAAPGSKCETCNGHGMIGGPSFYDPGEGGVECPDCVGSVGAALDRMDALLDPANGLLTVSGTSATVVASRADMALIRAALAAKKSP